ncbi:MAG: hypothetical protein ACW98F_20010, partial [Candidatus Hodarchaeales archaeon]
MVRRSKLFTSLCLSLFIWSIMMIGVSRSEFLNTSFTNESTDPHYVIEAAPKANFTGNYNSYPYDENSDGIYEELHVTVEISVHELGRFRVTGRIMNPDIYDDQHFRSEPNTFTNLGIYSLLFTVPGSWIWSQHTTTSYILEYIYLEELDEYDNWITEWDYAYNPYATITCNSDQFVTPSAYFTGNFIASLIDTDAPVDGLADFLAIDMEVQVEDEIDIEIQVELDLETGNHWNNEYYYDLSVGVHLLRVNFPSQIFYLTSETRNYTFNLQLMDTSEWAQIDTYYGFQTPFFNYLEFNPPGASLSGNVNDQGIDTDSDGTFNYVKLDIELNVVNSGSFRISGYISSDDGWSDEYFYTDFTLLEIGTQLVTIEIDRHFFYSQTSGSPVFIS